MNHGNIQSPDSWPSIWRWLSVSKRNAFELFPSDAYADFRVSNRLLHTRLSVISRPETIREICGTKASAFKLTNLQQRILSPSLGNGLILAEGESWKQQRRTAAKISASGRKRSTGDAPLITDRINQSIEHWIAARDPDQSIDLHSDLLMLSMDALSFTLFGRVAIPADASLLETISEHREVIEAFDLFDAVGAPIWFQSSKMKNARRIAARYNQVICDYLQYANMDPLDMPLAQKRDFIVSLMTGFESIANTCLWAIYEFTKMREIDQTRLVRASEAQTIQVDLNEPVDNLMTAWLMETLRLYPPLPLIYRKALQETDTLDGRIAKREVLCLSPWIVHRHRKLWDSADGFELERWWNVVPKTKRGFMPFGVGSRQCIGQHVGVQLSMRILQHCLSRVHFSSDPDMVATPRAGVTLRPLEPIRITVKPRSNVAKRTSNSQQNPERLYG